jgi:hypothetical protein
MHAIWSGLASQRAFFWGKTENVTHTVWLWLSSANKWGKQKISRPKI